MKATEKRLEGLEDRAKIERREPIEIWRVIIGADGKEIRRFKRGQDGNQDGIKAVNGDGSSVDLAGET